jgi:hypothetical protein
MELDMKSFEAIGCRELSEQELYEIDMGGTTTGFWLPNAPAWVNYIIIAIVGPARPKDPMVSASYSGLGK